MRWRRKRSATAPVVVLAAALGLSACGYEGPQDLPLPGGVGRDGYEVVVVLEDATNLVAHATCRSGDTVVGSIASVELDEDLHARVVCRISDDVELPGNVVATLRETSLLGERYVALDPPRGQAPTGRLAAGTTIPAERTTAHPDTETVLGALSLVLNGGSLGSIQVIAEELSAALEQPGDVRTTARRLTSLVETLDTRRDSLVTALDALARLSTTLADQRGVIGEALAAVPDGLEALERQRPALTRTLRRLSRLSRTAVPLIKRSKDATVADLKHLQPVLTQLSTAKNELSRTVERVASFPFSRNALSTIKGDYAGMYGQALIDVDTINALLVSLAELTPGPPVGAPASTGGGDGAAKPGKKPSTIAEVLADLDLTTLLDDAASGLGEALDLSALLDPGRKSGAGEKGGGTVPRDLGELLTGGGR
ncbi:MCE family protein [Nocardioides sp. zg-536]|uniref:MCE family protein n=1 Tax=Nocardioides faecalis TaxID=2803858 RepID=A0A938YB53_9ACTN|nr:MCE family protein [Nocardioides faecalis]MBM9461130.1 MCE family protein [Nocardioides faecalis]MBS4752216.1 MCE family protein [Nocardioides faecalis]QVI58986.1 MCE family protein [Nocardioides faecalis]